MTAGTGSGMLSGVSRVAADASAFNEGVNTSNVSPGVVTGSSTRANLYIESAYYTQEFRSGIPVLTDLFIFPDKEEWKTTMKMTTGLVPWREVFQKSPYTGDETQQFQNTALVNNAAIPVNAVAPTAAFQWHQGLGKWHSFDFKTALSSIDVSNAMNALAITYEGKLNYNWGWAADWLDLPGNIYAGGWWMNNTGGGTGLMTSATGINGGTTLSSADQLTRLVSNYANPAGQAAAFTSMGYPTTTATLAARLTGFGIPTTAAGLATTLNTLVPGLGATAANINSPLVQAQYAKLLLLGGVYYNGSANGSGILNGGTTTGKLSDDTTASGFYFGVNQEIHRGAGFFLSYGVMDTGGASMLTSALMNGTGANTIYNNMPGYIYGVKSCLNLGTEIPMKALHLPWRQKDVFGIGYAMINPNDAVGGSYTGSLDGVNTNLFGNSALGTVRSPNGYIYNGTATLGGGKSSTHAEHIIEAYYKVHLNDRFSITPNVQFIINRLGDYENHLLTVIGLRSTFNF